MLYLNYGKRETLSIKNKLGGNENLEAVDFLKKLNSYVFRYFPNVLMMAEDSSTFPTITTPVYQGGVGFNYKWNLGWMNDMLTYMQMDPIHRKRHHNLITFSLMYAFSENFVLPLSHDEVVHGKKSLLNKMPGDYWQKFANLRLFYGYMMAHPGKKLLFMGGEFGQFIEWRYSHNLDWMLLDYPMHKAMREYVQQLNLFYKYERVLWEIDHSSKGFQWIDHQNYEQSIISFMRISKDDNDFIIIVCNFTPLVYNDYKIGVPKFVHYKEVFNSDKENFGGSNQINSQSIKPELQSWHNQPYHIRIKIPPLAAVFIKPDYDFKIKNLSDDLLKGG
jgi:1,4-alpha-glucan branching enzyme